MNTRMIGFVLGRILLTEAGLLVLPAITAALYGEILWPWIASIILTAACGGALSSRKPERTALYAKDGFVAVALSLFFIYPLTKQKVEENVAALAQRHNK